MTIRNLLDNSVAHERTPTAVDPRLTVGAWVGLGLLALQVFVLHIGANSHEGFPTWGIVSWAFTGFGRPELALALTVTAVVAGLVGAVVTRGFTKGTTVGQSGQLGLLFGGAAAAIPTAWIVLVGAVVIAAIAAVGVVMGYIFIAILFDL